MYLNLVSSDVNENLHGFEKELYSVAPTMEELKIGEAKWECYQRARRAEVLAAVLVEIRNFAREAEGKGCAPPPSRFATYNAKKAANPHNRRFLQYHQAVADGVEGTLKGNSSLGCADITPDEFVSTIS